MGGNNLDSKILAEASFAEHHQHRAQRTFGKSADQSGNNWATEDRLTTFQAISGNGDYGSDANDEAKVFGSEDTPFISGHTKFDPGLIFISGVSSATEYIVRLIYSATTMADGISAGQYTTEPVKFDTVNPQLTAGVPIKFGCPKIPVGYKVWIQVKNATDNATLDFYITAHGYNEGA